MKMEVRREGIYVIPETAQDEAYIIDTLGLTEAEASIPLRRIPPMGFPRAIAYLRAEKEAQG